MNFTTVPFAILRFQYQLVRLPLRLIEDRVIVRMNEEAPARLFYERSLGVLDATVGHVLGDAKLEKRGSVLADRSDMLSRAARLDAAATQKEENADAELRAERDNVIDEQKQAREEKQRVVDAARSEADDRKRAAADAAQARTAAGMQRVDEVAAQRKNSIEESKLEAQARIRAGEEKASAAAQSKINDAQAKRAEAESKRAQADRLEALADSEKQKRQAARASKP
jgi:DNA-binding helix-hairpin-helix protein with protein kinase domain